LIAGIWFLGARFAVCADPVVDGDDLSVYDAADELQQQADRDVDTLNELQRELSSHSLVGLYTSHFTVTPTPTADWSVVITVFVCLSMSISLNVHVRSSPNFLCISPIIVAQSSSGGMLLLVVVVLVLVVLLLQPFNGLFSRITCLVGR